MKLYRWVGSVSGSYIQYIIVFETYQLFVRFNGRIDYVVEHNATYHPARWKRVA